MTAKLGDAFKTGTKPASGTNAGNWTVVFNPADMSVSLTDFECYRIVISGGPPGSTFTIYIGNRLYDSVFPGDTNSWDPNNPMKLSNGDIVQFYWNTGTTGFQPTVWLYFQEARLL